MKNFKADYRGEKVGEYDPEHFEKVPDKLVDDKGKAIAFRHKLVPKSKNVPYVDQLLKKDDKVIHRGMSEDEYKNIVRLGKIKSKGTHNIGDEQEGLTYFSKEPYAAGTYATDFAPNKIKNQSKDAYVVSVKKPDDDQIKKVPGTAEHEVGVKGSIDAKDIVAVHKAKIVAKVPAFSKHNITVS